MNLKQRIENHPFMVGIAVLAAILGVVLPLRSFFFPTGPSISNSGSGTLNNAGRDLNVYAGPKEKDPNSAEGAREALSREGKIFDEDGFAGAIAEGDLEQIKLYLIGGKSPNSLYNNNVSLLDVAMTNHAPHFGQIVDLLVNLES